LISLKWRKKLKKVNLSLFIGVLVMTVLASCTTTSFTTSKEYTRTSPATAVDLDYSDPFHVMRTNQLKDLPAGSKIGIISAADSGSFGLFMGAALEDKGLVVREMNLYSLLPPGQQYLTDPKNKFTFIDTLVKDTIDVVNLSTVTEDGEVVRSIDLDALMNKMLPMDDLVTEKQRVEHYLELVSSLKKMVESLNVDYILVGGSPYQGLSYSVKIYDTKTLDLVFSNLIVADETEWRRVVNAPAKSEMISYDFEDENEPMPFWELSYCEMVASKLSVK